MLTLIVPGNEFFNEETQQFTTVGDVVLELEHSLVSLSKWESEFEHAFLGPDAKTSEEVVGYVKAMTLNTNVSSEVFSRLSAQNFTDVNVYIESKQSATTFGEMPKGSGRGEIVTSELIYYWLVAFQIPFECEQWHINRLFALIRICNIKNGKQKKMSKGQIAQRNRDLNNQRREQLGTAG